MSARTLPNLGLEGGYEAGEDGWATGMALNLLKLSVLTQGGAIDKVAAEPGSPTAGDIYILDETHATHANEIAVYDGDVGEEAWVYIEPLEGWLMYNLAEGYFEKFDGAVWAEFATGGGGGLSSLSTEVVTEAGTAADLDPANVDKYQRWTNAAAKALTVEPEATTAQPANGEWHIRNVGAGDLTIIAGSGVVITPPNGGTLVVPQDATVTLKRIAEDEFDLFGQVVAA